MRWFRLWSELIDDPKICNMDEKTFRIFILLMCLAAEREQNGEIDLCEKDVAWRLRISQNILTRTKQKLEDLSILDSNNGNMRFINWDKRQFRSDCSTERVKRFRNVTRNNIETPPETETETETEVKKLRKKNKATKSSNGSQPEWIDPSTWDAFREHRKRLRKPMTEAAEKLIWGKLEEMEQRGINHVKALNLAIERGWLTVYESKDLLDPHQKRSTPIN